MSRISRRLRGLYSRIKRRSERLRRNFFLGWDGILRIFSDAVVDRSAVGILGVFASIYIANSSRPDIPALSKIDLPSATMAAACLGVFFFLWFLGRLLSRVAPAIVRDWRNWDSYATAKGKQLEKDEKGDIAVKEFDYWDSQNQAYWPLRMLITFVISLAHVILLSAFGLIAYSAHSALVQIFQDFSQNLLQL